jgi:hypothetical protein
VARAKTGRTKCIVQDIMASSLENEYTIIERKRRRSGEEEK